MPKNKDPAPGLISELRRGAIVLGVLSRLFEPRYGYSLVKELEDKGMPVEAGTLYPLLRRLESQGLLTSQWETSEDKPRKYYIISENGNSVYKQLLSEWEKMKNSIDRLTDKV